MGSPFPGGSGKWICPSRAHQFGGDWSVFVTRPLSAGLLAAAALLLVIVLMPAIKNKREEAFVED